MGSLYLYLFNFNLNNFLSCTLQLLSFKTDTCLTASFSRQPFWILYKARDNDVAVASAGPYAKSFAPHSKQTTTPAAHHSMLLSLNKPHNQGMTKNAGEENGGQEMEEMKCTV